MRRTWITVTGAVMLLFSCHREGARRQRELGARIQAGCSVVEECRELVSGARDQMNNCDEDGVHCGRAKENFAAASAHLDRVESDAREERDRSEREERREAGRQRARELTKKLEQQKQGAAAREEEWKADRVRDQQLIAEAKQEKRDKDLRYLRLLGTDGREKKLRFCHQSSSDCRQLMLDLVETTEDPERAQLVRLNEHLLQQTFAAEKNPRAGDIQCCDGSISETCVCGGRLSGCCSSHGGVCGCK